MSTEDLIRLRRFYKKAPKVFMQAAAATINSFAFGTQKQAKRVIGRKMVVRNVKFIAGSIQTTAARPNVPLSRLEAVTGSVHRPRYTGLVEQETGRAGGMGKKKDRVFTSAARGGNFGSPAKGFARLQPKAKYPSPRNARTLTGAKAGRKDFSLSGLSGPKRIVAFMSMLHESKKPQTFVIHKRFGRFKRGLYRFKQGVIRKMQSFDTKNKPKRVRWLTEGRKNYRSSVNVARVWARNINNKLKKFK